MLAPTAKQTDISPRESDGRGKLVRASSEIAQAKGIGHLEEFTRRGHRTAEVLPEMKFALELRSAACSVCVSPRDRK